MATKTTGLGVLALTFVLTVGVVAPASAEYFGGCNDQRRSSNSTRTYSAPDRHQTTGRYSNPFAGQSSRHVTYTRRSSRGYDQRWR